MSEENRGEWCQKYPRKTFYQEREVLARGLLVVIARGYTGPGRGTVVFVEAEITHLKYLK
jgi:hypothetical protein